jgi:hypothetical protein
MFPGTYSTKGSIVQPLMRSLPSLNTHIISYQVNCHQGSQPLFQWQVRYTCAGCLGHNLDIPCNHPSQFPLPKGAILRA